MLRGYATESALLFFHPEPARTLRCRYGDELKLKRETTMLDYTKLN